MSAGGARTGAQANVTTRAGSHDAPAKVGRDLDKPVLFVTGHAPDYRVPGLRRLHEMEGIEVALFGGRSLHGVGSSEADALPFPHREVRQRDLLRIAGSSEHRAVICSTGGRVALPATWAGARASRRPLLLWTSLWAHPRTAAHALSWLALKRLYRSADAIVTYGPHVSDYVRARGAENVHVAPQAVDNEFWSEPAATEPSDPGWPADASVRFLFAGRPAREKGHGALIEAWRAFGLQAPTAALVLVGVGSTPPWVPAGGAVRPEPAGARGDFAAAHGGSAAGQGDPAGAREDTAGARGDFAAARRISCIDPVPPEKLRNFYASADVLVVPSIPTRTFREPWGLVVNEAMNQGTPVIASDAVGAAAGGLVRDGHNGLIVPAGDVDALARAMSRLALDEQLRRRLGEAAARDVRSHTYEAWASGFSKALASVGLSRTHW